MEKQESKKIVPYLEVKTDGEDDKREVIARLINNQPVLFVLSKNFDLRISAGSHADIRRASGIIHEDQIAEGLIRLKNNVFTVQTRDKVPEEIESAIKEAVNIFLAGGG